MWGDGQTVALGDSTNSKYGYYRGLMLPNPRNTTVLQTDQTSGHSEAGCQCMVVQTPTTGESRADSRGRRDDRHGAYERSCTENFAPYECQYSSPRIYPQQFFAPH